MVEGGRRIFDGWSVPKKGAHRCRRCAYHFHNRDRVFVPRRQESSPLPMPFVHSHLISLFLSLSLSLSLVTSIYRPSPSLVCTVNGLVKTADVVVTSYPTSRLARQSTGESNITYTAIFRNSIVLISGSSSMGYQTVRFWFTA